MLEALCQQLRKYHRAWEHFPLCKKVCENRQCMETQRFRPVTWGVNTEVPCGQLGRKHKQKASYISTATMVHISSPETQGRYTKIHVQHRQGPYCPNQRTVQGRWQRTPTGCHQLIMSWHHLSAGAGPATENLTPLEGLLHAVSLADDSSSSANPEKGHNICLSSNALPLPPQDALGHNNRGEDEPHLYFFFLQDP